MTANSGFHTNLIPAILPWLAYLGTALISIYSQQQLLTIDLLEPYGDLVDYISVGIKDGKIQVIPWNYQVFESPRDMPLLPWESIMAHVSQNPVSAKKPRIRYLAKTDRWETFYGWQVAHKWLEGTDSDNRRIHVFFRPVREETPSARIRTNSEGVPMNYTFYEVE